MKSVSVASLGKPGLGTGSSRPCLHLIGDWRLHSTAGTRYTGPGSAGGCLPLLAQLDRAPGFEPGGWGFKSLGAGQPAQPILFSPARIASQSTPTRLRGGAGGWLFLLRGRCAFSPAGIASNSPLHAFVEGPGVALSFGSEACTSVSVDIHRQPRPISTPNLTPPTERRASATGPGRPSERLAQ